MQIRKSRLKQIIKEEVANAKYIDISEEAINQDEEAQEEAAEDAPPVEFSQNITLDEVIVQEIIRALGEEDKWMQDVRSTGEWADHTIEQLEDKKAELMKKEKRTPEEVKTVRQLNFAIRAKKGELSEEERT
tara:strand:+ start:662 stop:1057 length:396 start_codon:yes stop_codon:yes gene_type:complete